MSDRPRIRRKDPDRDAPMRSWSNMFRSPAASIAPAPNGNGAAMGIESAELITAGVVSGSASDSTASAQDQISDEARDGVEGAYRVIDEHLQEGRRAAQPPIDEARATAPGTSNMSTPDPAAIKNAAESLQEMIAQGVRFYSSLAPLWAGLVNSMAASAGVVNTSTTAAAT